MQFQVVCNSATLYILEAGVYGGGCSEFCGQQHSYMPICVIAIESLIFIIF